MKKFSILLTGLVFSVGLTGQTTETLTQFSNPDVFNDSTPLCQDATTGAPVVNHNSRIFDLATYGITSDFTVTKVDFLGSANGGTTVWAEVAEIGGDGTFIGDNIVVGEGYGSFTFPETLLDQWQVIEMIDFQTISGGTKFAVALGYEFTSGGNVFYMGNNDTATNPETSPSYIGWPGSGCVDDYDPQPVADVGFPVSWLFSVTGTVEGMGTVELNSKALSVYPNPATDVINVTLKNGEAQSIEITNLAGQNVYSAKAAASSVNVSFLPAGVYVVKVKDINGTTHMSKIVKK